MTFAIGDRVYVTGPFRSMYSGPWEIIEDRGLGFFIIEQDGCQVVTMAHRLSRQDPDQPPLKHARATTRSTTSRSTSERAPRQISAASRDNNSGGDVHVR